MTERTTDGFEYLLIEPPFPVKPVEKLSKTEARQEFEWFVGQSESRRQMLMTAILAGGVNGDRLNYTPASLVDVWSWALKNVRIADESPETYARRLAAAPAWVRKAKISMRELSLLTKCLCIDVGFYLAEVFLREYPQRLHWALGTKRTAHNRAFLEGFAGSYLVPSDLVLACCWMAVDGETDHGLLLNKYTYWEGTLTDGSRA